MTFQPVVPFSGYSGWRFLERTLESQKAAFVESAPITRATDNFRKKISTIQTAEDLVNDRQLLSVALGAFGLDDDIDNKFFIRKILEDGTLADDALGNRLADKSYAAFARAFGFGDFGARTSLTNFADEIVSRYEKNQFEVAVGDQNDNLRLAMNVESSIADAVEQSSSQNAQWYSVMGSPPLRAVFENALGLPASFAQIGLDQQLDVMKSRAESTFGTSNVADFLEPTNQEKLIRLFLIRSEAAEVSISSGSMALSMLQSMPNPYKT